MVINIRLIDRQKADSDDPLPRDWWGYDPDATPEQLWNHNRGIWALSGRRLATERWAALNYQGKIVLVAELDPEYEVLADNRTGAPKKALIGRVLPPQHPIHKTLIDTQVEFRRNPVSYDPVPETADPAAADPSDGASDAPGTSGQGPQMDADVRREIENAAQDRLMCHYRDRGWTVTDTRQNRPYDAFAVKGTEVRYL
jgi:hypothetical protein